MDQATDNFIFEVEHLGDSSSPTALTVRAYIDIEGWSTWKLRSFSRVSDRSFCLRALSQPIVFLNADLNDQRWAYTRFLWVVSMRNRASTLWAFSATRVAVLTSAAASESLLLWWRETWSWAMSSKIHSLNWLSMYVGPAHINLIGVTGMGKSVLSSGLTIASKLTTHNWWLRRIKDSNTTYE